MARKRSSRRRGSSSPRSTAAAPKSGISTFRHAYKPIDVLSEEEENNVHELSLKLLEEIGLKFLSRDAWPVLEDNGCRVDRETGMTWFPREVIEHYLALSPSSFTIYARNPANNLEIGGDIIHYGGASSAPNSLDLDNGRRPGNQKDFRNLIRIHHMLDTCGFHSGHAVEPIDVAANIRHLHSAYDWQTLSDKVTRIYAIGRTRVTDSIEMTKIAHEVDHETLMREPRLHGSININSPLVVDAPLTEAAMEIAINGQVNVISPVSLAGAMSPITLSGSVIQGNAECIGFIAFLQMVAPGCPCFYGVLSSPVDMKSGAPAMGTPETVTGTLSNGQMARRYNLPQRVWLGSTGVSPDAQSAYESMFSLWAAQLSGAHFVYHAHGWMEGGLTTGFEKTILDSEMIGMMGALRGSIDFSDADEILETIKGVGPGGHFLGCDHTMARYQTEFHPPVLSDWRPYEFWHDDGAPDTAVRANRKWKELLESYTPPAMNSGVNEQLSEFIERRTREIGSSEI